MVLLAKGERLIYFPQPLDPAARQRILAHHPQAREASLKSADGLQLQGWHLPGESGLMRPLAIYFGGNAEEVSWMLDFGAVFTGWDLALFNYRGYGFSAGKPSQQGLLQDALTIYDHFAVQPEIDAGRIVVIGRSLGSGVATYLASQRSVRGVLLVTPFDSLTAIAQNFYPFLPVRWVLGNLYDSAGLAPTLAAPLRMIVAEDDEVIPARHSQRLFEAWGGPKEQLSIAGAGHNDLQQHREYWRAIQTFLQHQR